MASPRDASPSRPDSPPRRPSDSFVESQQCSADASAFLGFHVPPRAEQVDAKHEPQKRKKTFKLVLDLGGDAASGGGFGPAAANPFSDLFAGDTQDDENAAAARTPLVAEEKSSAGTQRVSPPKRRRQREQEAGSRSLSPPPTMLSSMEREWRDRKKAAGRAEDVRAVQEQRKGSAEESNDETRLDDSMQGGGAFSEFSEDLAPRVFHKFASAVEAPVVAESGEKSADSGRFDLSAITEDSDRETDFEDDMECTQKLDDEADGDMTRIYGGPGHSDDEEQTEAFPYSDTGTLPYGPDSTVTDEDENGLAENAKHKDAEMSTSAGASHLEPTPTQKSDQRGEEDELTSRECTQKDYLTPRVNPTRPEKADSAELRTQSTAISVEQSSSKSQDDHDDCVATQPSRSHTEDDPVMESSSPAHQNTPKTNDTVLTSKPTGADSQTKAIRTLEFSFSMPESQDGEPQFSGSISSDAVSVSKSLETVLECNKPTPFESSISPVWPPTPTPVDDPAAPEITGVAKASQSCSKRKAVSALQSGLPTGKKKQKAVSQTFESPSRTKSPPKTVNRKRDSSPGSSSPSSEPGAGEPSTPRPPVRRSTRSTQSTPSSSTPTVRTRTRTLTPVPAHRTYASRSRTLFKYKFEFCLTGFVKAGEENLKELIEGHGGKIPERYQDILYKNNRKAVVIATPVSWRKRKFMQAIACGIPVVHTDWIKDCIEAGYVIPFDGYQVPAGYSVTTRKFECFPPREVRTKTEN
ncbi:unnamed protein product [Phytophthora fragariaefolia]|uniref:Unnamed protein product n=1 Tax=Phytophthora fragariaefolia TaxID=1490495 RepID=A0A9W6WKA1_9STRA|nr:unnamed protein product [Phytophthora fragariaefolia]